MAFELIPGTIVEYSTDGGTTYSEIPEVDELGEFGQDGSFIDVTSLRDTTNKYVGGRTDTPDYPITFKDTGVLAETNLLAAADARDTVKVKITFPSTAFYTFDVALSGYKSTPTGDVLKHTVNGKQSGKPVKG
ncbi:putative Phage protein [uncultured Thiomicrorhabdus sp.]